MHLVTWVAASITILISSTGLVPTSTTSIATAKEVFHHGDFFGDLMADEAERFIAKNKDRPFFIYYAINMPHYPYQGDTKWLEHYRALPYPQEFVRRFSVDDRRSHRSLDGESGRT